MQAQLGTGQLQGKQALLRTGYPYPMAGTQGRHQHTGISGHHTPPTPAGHPGILSQEQTRIQAVQGIPIEVAAGLGKGAVRDTAHMSETIPGQTAKEAVAHDFPGRAALADQGPDEGWQRHIGVFIAK